MHPGTDPVSRGILPPPVRFGGRGGTDIHAPVLRTVARPHRPIHRIAIALAFAAILAGPFGQPAPTRAATVDTASVMAADFTAWLSRDRVAAGLVPIRSWSALSAIATPRAGRMAASGTLSHTAAGGNVGPVLTAAGLTWYGFGEIIGESGFPWGAQSAANLYKMWKASAVHHAIMFSASYNYMGIGFVRRSDGTTWASIVFTESPDHTAPAVHNGVHWRSGTTLHFSWSGRDVPLQTHTAGLRSFDVRYRVDSGAWKQIRSGTTSTSLTLLNRAHRHWYSVSVRARDRRGNLSRWTTVVRIWVP